MYKNDIIGSIKGFFEKLADENPNAYFVAMDGMETFWCEEIKKKYPNRVIQGGISEQNALSVASGLALTGKLVYVFMLGMYSYCRAFDQLKLDVGYNNANVKIIGHGSGLWGIPGGYSHCGVEDLALLSSVPHLKIFTPILNKEWEYYLKYSAQNNGPMFMRLDFAYENAEMDEKDIKPTEFNKLTTFKKGEGCSIITYGTGMYWAEELKLKLNLDAEILYATSIEPFDYESLKKIISKKHPIITIEEHGKGGLASIVEKYIVESRKAVPFFPIYITNKEFNYTGSLQHVFHKLSNFDDVMNKLKEYYRHTRFIKNYYVVSETLSYGGKSHNKMDKSYCLFGLPIFTKRYSYKQVKYMLFKFIPIYNKKW